MKAFTDSENGNRWQLVLPFPAPSFFLGKKEKIDYY
jgi:hypothetical protein